MAGVVEAGRDADPRECQFAANVIIKNYGLTLSWFIASLCGSRRTRRNVFLKAGRSLPAR